MYQNRVAALAIAVLTLVGAASLVGTEENEGTLTSAAEVLAEKAAAASRNSQQAQPAPDPQMITAGSTSASASSPSASAIEFADDESLIDDAQGFDPSPVMDEADLGEVVVVVEPGSTPDMVPPPPLPGTIDVVEP